LFDDADEQVTCLLSTFANQSERTTESSSKREGKVVYITQFMGFLLNPNVSSGTTIAMARARA